MKKILGLLVLLTGVLFSCSDDDSDLDYGKEMYIENMKLFSESNNKTGQVDQPMFDVTFNFNDLNLITGADISQNGGEAETINLEGDYSPEKIVTDFLTGMIADGDAVEQDGNKIIKGYEFFQIKSRDKNNNVTEFTLGEGEDLTTIKIEYNSKPFFMYWNLKAAGIMNAIKNIQFFGSATDKKAEMVDALLPVNNISKVTIVHSENDELTFDISYEYDDDDMLTRIDASFIEIYDGSDSQDEGAFRVDVVCKK